MYTVDVKAYHNLSKFSQIPPSAAENRVFRDAVRGSLVFSFSFALNFLKTQVKPTLISIRLNLSPGTVEDCIQSGID